MTLLVPAALWLILIAFAVIALYLLKIRRRRLPVPSLEFWRQLVHAAPARSLFQRLKRWLSLLLWLVITACILLAIGNPILSLGKVKPRSIAIVLDNSASMQTAEGEEAEESTRLSLAIDAIKHISRSRPVQDEWLFIEAARRPRVLHGWTRDPSSIRRSAEEITPHFGTSDLDAGVNLASRLLGNRESPVMVVVSDGSAGTLGELISKESHAVHWLVGEAVENVGITRVHVRTNRQSSAHAVFVEVRNSGDSAVECDLVLEIDGSPVHVEPLELEPRFAWDKTIELDTPEGGVLRAVLDYEDSLPQDNQAFAVVEPIRPASVILVSDPDEAYFFEQALLAMDPLVDPAGSYSVTIDEFDERPPDGRSADLVVFNNCAPKTLPEEGRFVFVNVVPDALAARVTGVIDRPRLTVTERDHPLMQHLSLAGATVASAQKLDVLDHVDVLAAAGDGSPLILHKRESARSFLTLAFDMTRSDLPVRVAFPVLLRNAVTFFGKEQLAWVEKQYQIGEAIEFKRALPPDVESVVVGKPTEDGIVEENLSVDGRAVVYAATQSAGPIRFEIGSETAYTAVNLVSAVETAIRPVQVEEASVSRLPLPGSLFGMPPWFVLALAATALIGLEWVTFHHRWTE